MAATTYFVTVAGAGGKDGLAWSTAFGMAEFLTDLTNNAEAGDIYYVMAGTYTLTGAHDSSAKDGTGILPISIIGVKDGTNHDDSTPVYADWGSGADRPLFACGDNTFKVGDYHKLHNLRFTITTANGCELGAISVVNNCDSLNESTTANRYAFYGSTSVFINCNAKSTAGRAFIAYNCIFCKAYESDVGYMVANTPGTILHCIIDDCVTTGISIGNYDNCTILNNSIYSTPTSVLIGSGSYGGVYINNIIDTTTDGFKGTTQANDSNFYSHNHVGNSVTDMWDTVEETVVAHRDNNVTGGAGDDPEFNDEANGDFKLASTSPCIDAGMALTLGTSTAGKMNQGAYSMTQVQAGGGGGLPIIGGSVVR